MDGQISSLNKRLILRKTAADTTTGRTF